MPGGCLYSHFYKRDSGLYLTDLEVNNRNEVALIPPTKQPPSSDAMLDPASVFALATDDQGQLHLGIPIWTLPLILPVLIPPVIALGAAADPLTDPYHALEVTRPLLFVCADHSPALNLRKRALEALSPLTDAQVRTELMHSAVFLSRSPASSSQWHHRLWIISQQELPRKTHDGAMSDIFTREHAVIARAAARKQRNYYAWTYRIRLRQALEPTLGLTSNRAQIDQVDEALVQQWLLDGHGGDSSAKVYLAWMGSR
ncbi:hypothetical protein BC828DRAFT_390287 [Blastocladiella britannica]|nr:hypothetical protein BC828DRAFT_390287 [Blastocladiella britannica]